MTPDWHHFFQGLFHGRRHGWLGLWHLLNHFHYLVPLLFGGTAAIVTRYRQKLREGRAGGWPSTDAVIQSARVMQRNGYTVEVSYRYWAQQEYRYGKYLRRLPKKDAAERFAESVRGRTVQVRYRQDKPGDSVLMERDLELAGALAAS
jgi:hypothetical protein